MKKIEVGKNQKKKIELKKGGDYVVELVGAGAVVEVVGKFEVRKKDKLELRLLIVHRVANTRANTIIKAVGGGEAVIDIRGRIVVNEGARNTNSFLTEKVLLVSKGARATAIPDLEIMNDDVKCSHAATVSKIDENQVFYLMSRGLRRKQAESQIIEGFLR